MKLRQPATSNHLNPSKLLLFCLLFFSLFSCQPPVNSTPVNSTEVVLPPSLPATAQWQWRDYSYMMGETGKPASDGQYKFGNSTNSVYTAASSWESIKNANVLGLYQRSSDGSDNLNLFLGVPSNGIIVYELSSTQWVVFNVNSVHSGNTNDRGVFSISRHSYNDGSAIDPSRVHDPVRFGLSWNQEWNQEGIKLWRDYSYILGGTSKPASDGQYKFGKSTNCVYTAASSWESIKNANVLGLYQNSSDGSDNLNLFLGVPSNGIIVYELSSTQWVAFNVNSVHNGNTNDRGVFGISRHSYNDGSAIDPSRVHDPVRFGLSWNRVFTIALQRYSPPCYDHR